jgi:8-oxo-dGTP pyrophosphatase MutT (NUDIX family)
MYKVFFNGHLLVLGNEIQNSFKDNIDQSIEIEEINDLIILLLKLEKVEYVVKLVISCKNGKNLFEMLSNSLTKITAAGGVVKNLQQEILFIKRLGRWDLPKGKTEQGESARQAAIREVEEECGIKSLIITRQLPCTYHIYRSPYIDKENNWVLKETSWFEMEYHGNDLPVPETKEQIEAVQWFSKRQLPVVLENTYGSLKDMISSYLA